MDSLFRKSVCSHIQEWPSINGSQSQDIHVWNTHFLLSSFFFSYCVLFVPFFICFKSVIFVPSWNLQLPLDPNSDFSELPESTSPAWPSVWWQEFEYRCNHLCREATVSGGGAFDWTCTWSSQPQPHLLCMAEPQSPWLFPGQRNDGGDLGGGVKPQAVECSSFPSLLISRVAFASDCCEIDRCRRIAANT